MPSPALVPSIHLDHPGYLWLLLAIPAVALLLRRAPFRDSTQLSRATLLRLAALALVILALAQPLLQTAADGATTIFVIDRSRSVDPETADAVERWVSATLSDASPGTRIGVVTVGASPALAAPLGPADDVGNWFDTPIDPDGTDLASGLTLAGAIPTDGNRRIVLVTDGAETTGDLLAQIDPLDAGDIPVHILPLPAGGASDLRIDALAGPAVLWQNEPANLLATLATDTPGTATLTVSVDGAPATTESLPLVAGTTPHPLSLADLAPGVHTVDVAIAGEGDRLAENNVQSLVITVRTAPAVLFVHQPGNDGSHLATALENRGATVTQTEPAGLPVRISAIDPYDAIVVNDIAASDLTLDQVALLQEAAKSLGRGVIVVGGSNSYGPGGYSGTTLEALLPVTVKVVDARQRPRVALLLIVDKSGSMSYDPAGGVRKIDLAIEALKLAVTALVNGDQIGILAFSDEQRWVVPFTTISGESSRNQVNAAVDTLRADGGTEIYPALSVGIDALRNVDADVRHVVLLSDGRSRTGTTERYLALIDESRNDRVTVSTIAMGTDADADLLALMAEHGNGRAHVTESADDIPNLTLAEAQSAGSQAVVRGSFAPIQSNPSPIMAGFDPAELPPVGGYDFAEPKDDAQIVLSSNRADPLLAKWQYGLGRVVAWTADDGTDFATGWADWADYDRFWGQVLQWTLPDPAAGRPTLSAVRDGNTAVVSITTPDGLPLPDDATVSITSPTGQQAADVTPYRQGPDRYDIRVADAAPGAYRVIITAGGQTIDTGVVVPQSTELLPQPDATDRLETLARRTGGTILSLEQTDGVLATTGDSGQATRSYSLASWLLAAALLAFLAEIALRYRVPARLEELRRPVPDSATL